ncbi:hypothetical protein SprV_0301224400 [Sparganum proliferum]
MNDTRLSERIFSKDVTTGCLRQEDRVCRYKDTLKASLKRLQINPADWEELARDHPTWKRIVKTGAVIYGANCIAADKAKREAGKSQLRPSRNASAQPPPTCPRCQRTFQAPPGLVGHLWTGCSTLTAPTVVSPSTSPSLSTQTTNTDSPPEPPLPSYSSSSPIVSTSAVVVSATHINITHNSDTSTNTNTTTVDTSGEDLVYT